MLPEEYIQPFGLLLFIAINNKKTIHFLLDFTLKGCARRIDDILSIIRVQM